MNSSHFNLLVFDWDGTIVDSAAAIVLSLQEACKALNLPIPDDESARSIIGLGMREALFQVVPGITEDQFMPLVDAYRESYAALEKQVVLFNGVKEGLEQLRNSGFMLAVATGKSRRGLNRGIERAGLQGFFDYTRCVDECPSKPAPDMLYELMDFLNASPDKTLMIGDTTHDLQMALNAKVPSAGMLYGAHSADALIACHPLALFKTFPEFVNWVMHM